MAEEGADIIAIDLCEQIDSVRYPMGTAEDLAHTVEQVEKLDRRVVSRVADVRERDQLRAAVDEGVAELGRLDVVVANAGILPVKHQEPSAFVDAVDVDFGGVLNLVAVSLPHLQGGASIIITGSIASLLPGAMDNNPVLGPGGAGYGLAKQLLVPYMESLAIQLAPKMIRANLIHPTNTDTNLLQNDELYKVFRPDLDNPTRDDAEQAFPAFHLMPIPYADPVDISHAVVFLASDESRYVTGIQLRVDGGAYLRSSRSG
jgi:NAD(P)-dependent dehydrogenase (short-subunit alcohol dehydrogenase family)